MTTRRKMEKEQDFELFNYKIPRATTDSNTTSNDAIPTIDSILMNCYANATITYAAQSGPKPNPTVPMRRPITAATNSSAPVTYKDTYACNRDRSLPSELTELFQPLYCKLCAMQLTSAIMARAHYESRNHEKKVRKYLMDYSERTGEPLHEKAIEISSKRLKKNEDLDAKYFFCNVCDLPLTGKLHAESHYMGRNHRKVAAGKGKPSGPGFYKPDGKWIRTLPKAGQDADRDNIGLDVNQTSPFIGPIDKKMESLFCLICSVQATCEAQFLMHQNGQKHKKRLKQLDLVSEGDSSEFVNGDLSKYRTPSGQFYCNPCNLSLNSDLQFKQHLNSKRHTKKLLNIKD